MTRKTLIIALFPLVAVCGPFDVFTDGGSTSSPVNVTGDCDYNFDIPQANNICGSVSGISNLLNQYFSIGGCNVSTSSTKDFFGGLGTKCTNLLRGKDIGVMSPLTSTITSSNEYTFISGAKGTDCSAISSYQKVKHPSGWTNEQIEKETTIDEMSERYGIFSSGIDDLRDCMKLHGDKCKEDGFMKLPEDSVATEKAILEASNHIAISGESVSANIASVEAEEHKKLEECVGLEGKKADECVQKVRYSKDSTESQAKKEIAKIELASAAEFNAMNKATRGDIYYVFKDSASMDKMPRNVANVYADGVARQNAADVLIGGLYKETLNLKKNIVTLSYGKAEAMSVPYDPKASIEDLKYFLLEEAKNEK